MMFNVFLFVAAMAVSMMVTMAFADETMLACTLADGSIMYTNKDLKGCSLVKTPELSVVPSYGGPHPSRGSLEHGVFEPTPAIVTPQDSPYSAVLADTCKLYHEWVLINQRTMGGFEYNSVDDTKRRLFLTKIFGSGFSPASCK